MGPLGGAEVAVRRFDVTAPDGRSWFVVAAGPVSPAGLERAHKSTAATTPVAVALPAEGHGVRGRLHAGLPVTGTSLPMSANAQFDPVASRRSFADSPWNLALCGLLADAWRLAVLDVFGMRPRAAWALLPPPAAPGGRDPLTYGRVAEHLETLVKGAAGSLPVLLRLPTRFGGGRNDGRGPPQLGGCSRRPARRSRTSPLGSGSAPSRSGSSRRASSTVRDVCTDRHERSRRRPGARRPD